MTMPMLFSGWKKQWCSRRRIRMPGTIWAVPTIQKLASAKRAKRFKRSLILETEGQPAVAMEAYRKAIAWQEQNSQPSEQPYVNLGNLLMEQGQIKEAIEPLEKAVALAPNNAFCHMTLGVYYRKAGQMESAQRELMRATQLEPDNAVAHYQLGRVYKEINDVDRAKAEFERTAELQNR